MLRKGNHPNQAFKITKFKNKIEKIELRLKM